MHATAEQIAAELLPAFEMAVVKAMSPWRDREGAAAYACCSVAEIDRAANEGIIKRHFRGRVPMFRTNELDDAIMNGTWTPRVAAEREAA